MKKAVKLVQISATAKGGNMREKLLRVLLPSQNPNSPAQRLWGKQQISKGETCIPMYQSHEKKTKIELLLQRPVGTHPPLQWVMDHSKGACASCLTVGIHNSRVSLQLILSLED